MVKKKQKKILRTILVVDSPTHRPSYLVMASNRRDASMIIYDSIEDILEDYPIHEYSIMITSVQTIKVINQIALLW